jgi:hypothetical protein
MSGRKGRWVKIDVERPFEVHEGVLLDETERANLRFVPEDLWQQYYVLERELPGLILAMRACEWLPGPYLLADSPNGFEIMRRWREDEARQREIARLEKRLAQLRACEGEATRFDGIWLDSATA